MKIRRMTCLGQVPLKSQKKKKIKSYDYYLLVYHSLLWSVRLKYHTVPKQRHVSYPKIKKTYLTGNKQPHLLNAYKSEFSKYKKHINLFRKKHIQHSKDSLNDPT